MSTDRKELTDEEIDAVVEASWLRGYVVHFDLPNPERDEDDDTDPVPAPDPGPDVAPKTPGCWMGGDPKLPADIEWPMYVPGGSRPAVPMLFVGQLDCAQLPPIEQRPEIPRSGHLLFFYEPVYDCRHQGHGKVIYLEGDLSDVPYRQPPPMPDIPFDDLEWLLFREDDVQRGPQWNFTPVVFDTWEVTSTLMESMFDQNPTRESYEKTREKTDQLKMRQMKTAPPNPDYPDMDLMEALFGQLSLFGSKCLQTGGSKYESSEWISLGTFWGSRLRIPWDNEGAHINFLISREDCIARDFSAAFVSK